MCIRDRLDNWLKPVGTLENADESLRSKRLFGELVSLQAAATTAPTARERILTRCIDAVLFGVRSQDTPMRSHPYCHPRCHLGRGAVSYTHLRAHETGRNL